MAEKIPLMQFIEAYTSGIKAGKTESEISRELGVGPSAVSSRAISLGLREKRVSWGSLWERSGKKQIGHHLIDFDKKKKKNNKWMVWSESHEKYIYYSAVQGIENGNPEYTANQEENKERYPAYIKLGGKTRVLDYYDTPEEAQAAEKRAKEALGL